MGLREYHRKRNFAITPEPRGEEGKGEGRSFCVQKHRATRLHYDFRLEMEGVLRSWAVPKGPSYDPADKRLAMHTEDHPLDYGDFEGVIPEGQYGGGTVLLWDRGTWEPLEDPHKGYRAGKLKFRLQGEKLRGGWTLVKIRGRDARDDEKSWLLIKETDETAMPGTKFSITDERPESVATGRSLEEIAAARDAVWESRPVDAVKGGRWRPKVKAAKTPAAAAPAPAVKRVAVKAGEVRGARKGPLPRFLRPQLATLVTDPPGGEGWLHEMKFDGYRILSRLQGGRATLMSRNGNDWTAHFPQVAAAVQALPASQAMIDGEVAVLLPNGTTSFQALQNALSQRAQGELVYFAFDLPHLDGYDLTRAGLEDRKAALAGLLSKTSGAVRYSAHVVGSGDEFFASACALLLEGIVSKRRDAPYEMGRGRGWLKVKCLRRQEVVIGGFTEPTGSRAGLGALLVGVHGGGALVYVGKVGTGYTDKVLKDLRRSLEALEQPACPFQPRPKGVGSPHWVKPELVAEVAFSEWTGDGKMRHPSFQGLRTDKPAREVVRERAAPTEDVAPGPSAASKGAGEAAVAGVRLTHPDRALYPEPGITKRALAEFYEGIADWILPHVAGRPLTLLRCPEGLAKECFYMKHSELWAPPALRRVKIREKTKVGDYLVVDDLAGIISLVQMGILEIHTWNSTADSVEEPTRMVFDLDPGPAVRFDRVVAAARRVREMLLSAGLESFVKTTGGKGLHVVVPLGPGHGWDETFGFSQLVASQMVREEPRTYTDSMPKAGRKDKILVDVLRNNRGSTSVAAYSTRARPAAPVSVPLAWEELDRDRRPDHYTVENLPRRLSSLKADPWARYSTVRQKIAAPRASRARAPRRAAARGAR